MCLECENLKDYTRLFMMQLLGTSQMLHGVFMIEYLSPPFPSLSTHTCYLKVILGEVVSRPTVMDQELAKEIVSCQKDASFKTIMSGTMCTDDFYEGWWGREKQRKREGVREEEGRERNGGEEWEERERREESMKRA
jgi:hypothetical protein